MKKLLAIILILAMLLPGAALADKITNIGTPDNGYVAVMNPLGFCGVADMSGKITIPFAYERIRQTFPEGVAVVCVDGLYGYVDAATGETIVPCEFPSVEDFSDGVGVVKTQDGLYCAYNRKGELLFEKAFYQLSAYSEGLAVAKSGGKEKWDTAFVDKKGEVVLEFSVENTREVGGKTYTTYSSKYSLDQNFHDGLAAVLDVSNKRAYYRGFINTKGEPVSEFKYAKTGDFVEGYASVSVNGKLYGFINKKGEEVVPLQYKKVEDFSEGLALVMNEDYLYGFVNGKGKEVVPCQYDQALSFSSGLAAVVTGGKIGFIDEKGKLAIDAVYENGNSFVGKYCAVKKDGMWGVIDKKGKTVVPFEYDYMAVMSEKAFLGMNDGELISLKP